MERLIKFRAWNKERELMFPDYHKISSLNFSIMNHNKGNGKLIIMQFTGLKDKNGCVNNGGKQ